MDKGDSFLMGVLHGSKKHLWVVLSDTKKHCGHGVIVNVSKDEERSGGECPLTQFEHPWLDEPMSWVCYGDAVLMTPKGWIEIRRGIADRIIVVQPKSSDALVAKLIAGAKQSASKPYGAFRKDYLPYLD